MLKRQAPLDSNSGDGNGNQGYGYSDYNGHVSWWWTPVRLFPVRLSDRRLDLLTTCKAGMATRYGICALLFILILAFFVGGYYHAQHRMRNGQPLLAYHRWMVRRPYQYPPSQPRYGYDQTPYSQSYPMDAPPPPAYNSAEAPPPVYYPPQGATKAMADQNFGATTRAGEGSASAGVSAPPAASTSR